jgi:cytochrome c oxidase assembly protein subunit 15
MAVLAMVSSPRWGTLRPAGIDSARDVARDPAWCASLRAATLATAGLVVGQLVLGAVMRHTGAGLAIPDFPLALGRVVPPLESPGVAVHFAHRAFALVLIVAVGWTASVVLRSGVHDPWTRRLAGFLVAAVGAQAVLGALTVLSAKAVLPTTLHVAVGASILASAVTLAVRVRALPPAVSQGRALAAGAPRRAAA